MKRMTDHARDRLRERYHMALSGREIAQLFADCESGKAACMRRDERGATYVVRVREVPVVALINHAGDRIVTFFPPDYFNRGHRLAHRKNKHPRKQRGKASEMAMNPEYKRAKLKRLDMEDA